MRKLGETLAASFRAIEAPLVIAIRGDLGAGKTTLVGGILNALGVTGYAKSPTYTLIEPYEIGDRCIYHLDLYRLTDPGEVEALGLRELQLPRSVFLIEWPERGTGMLPATDLEVRIEYVNDSERAVCLRTGSAAGRVISMKVKEFEPFRCQPETEP